MKVIPRITPNTLVPDGTLCTNGFTIGRTYVVVGMQGNCGVVMNDNGHERIVLLDGSPCAHIVARSTQYLPTGRYGYPVQDVVGYFEVVPE